MAWRGRPGHKAAADSTSGWWGLGRGGVEGQGRRKQDTEGVKVLSAEDKLGQSQLGEALNL